MLQTDIVCKKKKTYGGHTYQRQICYRKYGTDRRITGIPATDMLQLNMITRHVTDTQFKG